MSRFKRVDLRFWKIRISIRLRRDDEPFITDGKWLMPSFQENPLSFRLRLIVPQTDTGGRVENTKALERTQVKELGKMAP